VCVRAVGAGPLLFFHHWTLDTGPHLLLPEVGSFAERGCVRVQMMLIIIIVIIC
jgi:hypothetical protein